MENRCGRSHTLKLAWDSTGRLQTENNHSMRIASTPRILSLISACLGFRGAVSSWMQSRNAYRLSATHFITGFSSLGIPWSSFTLNSVIECISPRCHAFFELWNSSLRNIWRFEIFDLIQFFATFEYLRKFHQCESLNVFMFDMQSENKYFDYLVI